MRVDDVAWGFISDKFVRVRVQLPLYRALCKEILLADEITEEVAAVQIRYERLPNFCLFCGFIGHMEAKCDMSKTEQKIEFNLNLRVLPAHFEFPQRWFLPDAMGQMSSSQDTPLQLWRAPTPANLVEQVVDEVARLSVEDNHEQDLAAKYSSNNKQINPNDKEKNLEEDKQATQDLSDKKSKKGWKRKARENMSDQSGSPKDNVIQNTILAQGARMVRSQQPNSVTDGQNEVLGKKKEGKQTFESAAGNKGENEGGY